jgi:hypothetical protein
MCDCVTLFFSFVSRPCVSSRSHVQGIVNFVVSYVSELLFISMRGIEKCEIFLISQGDIRYILSLLILKNAQ